MRALNNIAIAVKIPFIVAALIIVQLLVGGHAILSMREMDSASRDIRDNWLPSASANGSIVEAFDTVRTREVKYLLANTPELKETLINPPVSIIID